MFRLLGEGLEQEKIERHKENDLVELNPEMISNIESYMNHTKLR